MWQSFCAHAYHFGALWSIIGLMIDHKRLCVTHAYGPRTCVYDTCHPMWVMHRDIFSTMSTLFPFGCVTMLSLKQAITVFDLISEHTLISGHPPILCWWRLLPEHIEIYVYWLCYCVASCNRYLMLINHPTDGATLTLRVRLLGRIKKQKKQKIIFLPNKFFSADCSLIRSNTV